MTNHVTACLQLDLNTI